MLRGFVTVLAVLALAGCASSGVKSSTTAIQTFKPGVTTMVDAKAALGQPFQVTRMPDGSQQWQYISKVSALADDSTPTTGSSMRKRKDSTVSTMLSFDQSGHFVRAWSNAKNQNSPSGASDLGTMGQGDLQPNAGH